MTNYRIIHETNDTMYVFVPLLKMTGNGVIKRIRRNRFGRAIGGKAISDSSWYARDAETLHEDGEFYQGYSSSTVLLIKFEDCKSQLVQHILANS